MTPPASPATLARQLDRLEKLYGVQEPPPPRGALEWILWENAAYLVRVIRKTPKLLPVPQAVLQAEAEERAQNRAAKRSEAGR